MGFNKEQIIFFKIDAGIIKDKYSAFKDALLELPGVAQITRTGMPAWNHGAAGVSTIKCLETGITVQARLMLVDSDFLSVYEIPIIAGRNFSGTQENFENFCIINNAAKNILRINDISQKTLIQDEKRTRLIIGATGNFQFQFPFKTIDPLVMVATDKYYGMNRPYISVRLLPLDHTGTSQKNTMIKIKNVVNRFFPELNFSYNHVEKKIEKMHRQKTDPWKNILKFSTWIYVFLAFLGLLGFAEYEIDQKTKEIGIRKVLGALRLEIASYFTKQFAKIAIIANIIAWPIINLFTKLVAQKIEYQYSFNLELHFFISVTLYTLVFTFFIVSIQIFRAISVDPQNVLRDE